jgi:hypothetical protein
MVLLIRQSDLLIRLLSYAPDIDYFYKISHKLLLSEEERTEFLQRQKDRIQQQLAVRNELIEELIKESFIEARHRERAQEPAKQRILANKRQRDERPAVEKLKKLRGITGGEVPINMLKSHLPDEIVDSANELALFILTQQSSGVEVEMRRLSKLFEEIKDFLQAHNKTLSGEYSLLVKEELCAALIKLFVIVFNVYRGAMEKCNLNRMKVADVEVSALHELPAVFLYSYLNQLVFKQSWLHCRFGDVLQSLIKYQSPSNCTFSLISHSLRQKYVISGLASPHMKRGIAAFLAVIISVDALPRENCIKQHLLLQPAAVNKIFPFVNSGVTALDFRFCDSPGKAISYLIDFYPLGAASAVVEFLEWSKYYLESIEEMFGCVKLSRPSYTSMPDSSTVHLAINIDTVLKSRNSNLPAIEENNIISQAQSDWIAIISVNFIQRLKYLFHRIQALHTPGPVNEAFTRLPAQFQSFTRANNYSKSRLQLIIERSSDLPLDQFIHLELSIAADISDPEAFLPIYAEYLSEQLSRYARNFQEPSQFFPSLILSLLSNLFKSQHETAKNLHLEPSAGREKLRDQLLLQGFLAAINTISNQMKCAVSLFDCCLNCFKQLISKYSGGMLSALYFNLFARLVLQFVIGLNAQLVFNSTQLEQLPLLGAFCDYLYAATLQDKEADELFESLWNKLEEILTDSPISLQHFLSQAPMICLRMGWKLKQLSYTFTSNEANPCQSIDYLNFFNTLTPQNHEIEKVVLDIDKLLATFQSVKHLFSSVNCSIQAISNYPVYSTVIIFQSLINGSSIEAQLLEICRALEGCQEVLIGIYILSLQLMAHSTYCSLEADTESGEAAVNQLFPLNEQSHVLAERIILTLLRLYPNLIQYSPCLSSSQQTQPAASFIKQLLALVERYSFSFSPSVLDQCSKVLAGTLSVHPHSVHSELYFASIHPYAIATFTYLNLSKLLPNLAAALHSQSLCLHKSFIRAAVGNLQSLMQNYISNNDSVAAAAAVNNNNNIKSATEDEAMDEKKEASNNPSNKRKNHSEQHLNLSAAQLNQNFPAKKCRLSEVTCEEYVSERVFSTYQFVQQWLLGSQGLAANSFVDFAQSVLQSIVEIILAKCSNQEDERQQLLDQLREEFPLLNHLNIN